jgi:hypothetical protein
MKYAIIFTALLALTACKDERPSTEGTSGREYRIECIGGIEYWHRPRGQASLLAVRVDPETMTFVRCEGN